MEIFLLMWVFAGYVTCLFILTGKILESRIKQLEKKRKSKK